MVDFVNKLELSGQKYQTNGNVKDENYNGNFLFLMKEFVSPFYYSKRNTALRFFSWGDGGSNV